MFFSIGIGVEGHIVDVLKSFTRTDTDETVVSFASVGALKEVDNLRCKELFYFCIDGYGCELIEQKLSGVYHA